MKSLISSTFLLAAVTCATASEPVTVGHTIAVQSAVQASEVDEPGVMAQPLDNPSFEKSEDGRPAGWEIDVADGYAVRIAGEFTTDGNASLRMMPLQAPQAARARQSLDPRMLSGRGFKFTGAIRTQGLQGQAVLYVIVKGGERTLFTDDMRRRAVAGTTDWAYYTIVVPPLPDADEITVGALVIGNGDAWFDDLKVTTVEASGDMSAESRRYLTDVLDVMQERALVRDQVDWPSLRQKVFAAAQGTQAVEETHAAIQYALTLLGDPHSSFMPATPSVDKGKDDVPAEPRVPEFESTLLQARFGYLDLPGFPGGVGAELANAYATRLQGTIEGLEAAGACGWIIDLRSGAGGNMWPVLAGLGPLLGDGEVGRCATPSGETGSWWYRDGKAGVAETIKAATAKAAIHLQDPAPPIAVLISEQTASSGEAIAIALSGRSNGRTFGEQTAGLATANGGVALPDGSLLVLTLCAMEDRNGNRFPDGIAPEVAVEPAAAVAAATQWLATTEACRAEYRIDDAQ